MEKHTQRENENDTETTDSGANRSGNFERGGCGGILPTSSATMGNQLPGVAPGITFEGVSSGQVNKAHTGAPMAGDSGNLGDSMGGRTERPNVAKPVELDSLSATLAKLGAAPNFDGRTFTEFATAETPVDVAATRGESPVTATKQTVATRGKSRPVVEAVKSSKGTWQFRLRWNSEPGRPVHYVATVADSTYEIIRKGDYEGYKKALIADYEASAISAD